MKPKALLGDTAMLPAIATKARTTRMRIPHAGNAITG
jgi:hypothetical protein